MAVTQVSIAKGSSNTTAASWGSTSGATSTTAGNLLVLSVACQNNSSASNSVSTPTGWTAGPSKICATSTQRAFVQIFYKIAAGSDAVPTFTVTGANTTATILEEWSGLAASSVVDITFATGAGTAVGGTAHAGPDTTTNATDWIYAAAGLRNGGTRTWGGGQTEDDAFANGSGAVIAATQTTSSTGSFDPTLNIISGLVALVAVAFKLASSGGATVALPVVNLALAAPAPAVSGNASVALPVVNLTLAAPAPTPDGGVGDATVAVPVVGLTLAAPAPSLSAGANVALPVVALVLAAPTPSVSGGAGDAGVALPVVNLALAAPTWSLTASVDIGLPVVNLDLASPAVSTDGKQPLDRVTGTLYDTDGLTVIGTFKLLRNVTWQDISSQPGSATFEVGLDDPLVSEATARRIVKLRWYRHGKKIATFGCRLQADVAELAVDGRRWVRFESQPGLLSLLGDAVVYPEYGLKRRSSSTRLFGFMSDDGDWRLDGDWLRPSGYPFSEETGHRKGRPSGMQGPDPDWIAALWPATHVSPKTINYYRETVTLADGKYAELVVTADNFLTVYLDGEEIATPDYSDPLGWMHVQSIPLQLDAGDRLFAYKVENAPLANGGGGNPLGLIYVLYEVDNDGHRIGIIKQSTAGAASMAVHDNTPSPGWFPAQVLRKLVLEAQGRGVDACEALTIAFTDFHDSTGAQWAGRGEFAFDIGTVTVSDIATQLAESGMDVAVGAETMRLLGWLRRGSDKSGTVALTLGDAGGTLVAFESTETPTQLTRILTQLEDGSWVETVDSTAEGVSGRIESALSLGSATDEGTATDVGSDQLGQYSTARTSVTSEPTTVTGPVAYIDYGIGDTITVPGPRNVGTMKARVLAITVDASGDTVRAWPEYVEDPTA